MTVKKKKTEQTPKIPIQMGMGLMMETKKKMEQTPMIPIQTAMGLMMERMTFPKTLIKIKIPTEMGSVMTKTQTMMEMAFRMNRKKKMEQTPKTQIPMETE